MLANAGVETKGIVWPSNEEIISWRRKEKKIKEMKIYRRQCIVRCLVTRGKGGSLEKDRLIFESFSPIGFQSSYLSKRGELKQRGRERRLLLTKVYISSAILD